MQGLEQPHNHAAAPNRKSKRPSAVPRIPEVQLAFGVCASAGHERTRRSRISVCAVAEASGACSALGECYTFLAELLRAALALDGRAAVCALEGFAAIAVLHVRLERTIGTHITIAGFAVIHTDVRRSITRKARYLRHGRSRCVMSTKAPTKSSAAPLKQPRPTRKPTRHNAMAPTP